MDGKFNRTKAGSMLKELKEDTKRLELLGVIGLNGTFKEGMLLHPDDEHLIIALGSTIIVKHVTDAKQYFLQEGGHDREVCAMALSKSGKFLASGQESTMGFPAPIIIWNLETCEAINKLVLHKGQVQDLCISPDERYLVSLGGRDDNKIVVWDLETGQAICGASAANQTTSTVSWHSSRSDMIVSAGKNGSANIWTFDQINRKLTPHQINMGSMRRHFLCSAFSHDGKTVYLGTSSGDVLAVSAQQKVFMRAGPSGKPRRGGKSHLLGKGVVSIALCTNHEKGNIVVGGGDGTVSLLEGKSLRVIRSLKLKGGATSISLNAEGDHFFVGTDKSNLYLVALDDFDYEIRSTCNSSGINGVSFPRSYSKLFATCSSDVRLWNAQKKEELLRIEVPNKICQCICISPDGKAVITGWNDGKIRAFKPKSAKLMYVINNAHRDSVTAIACTSDSKRLVSGGKGGEVRIWNVGQQTQTMIASLKQHKSTVNSIMIDDEDSKCVSAASDGSCIIWCLDQYNRDSCLYAVTQFKDAVYHPDQSQLLTAGTDRKITYWDVIGSTEIRIIDGGDGDINSLDITPDGDWFVSGGADRVLRLWNYDEGEVHYVGKGHSGAIMSAKVSPDQSFIVTVGTEGGIFMWKMPEAALPPPAPLSEKAQKRKVGRR